MAECRECERQIPEDANFCSHCGAPQNEKAARALESFTKRRLEELPPDELETLLDERVSSSSKLESRISYALGWITLVVGLAMIPSLATIPVVLGGIVVLPPVRRLVGETVGRSPGTRVVGGVYVLIVGIGAALFWLL